MTRNGTSRSQTLTWKKTHKKTGQRIPYAVKVRHFRLGIVIRVENGFGRRLLAHFWDIVRAPAIMGVIRGGQELLARDFISRLAEE